MGQQASSRNPEGQKSRTNDGVPFWWGDVRGTKVFGRPKDIIYVDGQTPLRTSW